MMSVAGEHNGTIRFDRIPSEKSVLTAWSALRDKKLSMTPRSFEVPEIEGDYEDVVLDLGEIHLAPQ